MVSTRPSPAPARGRIAYPTASTYVPGDADNSPTYLGVSEPIRKTTSRDSEKERVQGLKTWWKGFRDREEATRTASGRRVFGVPLAVSIEYASVQVSTSGPDGSLYVWGIIPVVVAKCGLHLKECAVEVEGTFRISGSAKRMRELQTLFDTGPKYGKNIDWSSLPFTTHDVATIFRRFLTQMPEPIVPTDFYNDFRNVIAMHTAGQLSIAQTVADYKSLIQSLPRTNLYLLLYVLDLLSVFAKRSDKNLMTAPNLALIFQPGVLSHPLHAMRPREHVQSQQVLEFLIEHQDNFLIGMELTKSKRRKDKSQQPSRTISPPGPSSPPAPSPPPLVKAHSDLMLPSDSDDDAPVGGYYIVESAKRPVSPAVSPHLASSLPSIDASLLPSKPIRASPKPNMDLMEPSDSDEDAPPGGYEVRTGDPARARAALLARAKTKVGSSSVASSGLSRRKTVPARRIVADRRSASKEAP